LSQQQLRDNELGTYHTLTGLVALPSSLIAGFLWEIINPSSTFLFGSIISLIAIILFAVFISIDRDS